jgi:uncharacterized protein (UPF0335 family)
MEKAHMHSADARRRLVHHITQLEQLEARKKLASDDFKTAIETAQLEGYDGATLKVVLKLRKLTPAQRLERRALEAIYMAAIGLLDGEALPDEARRRFSGDAEDRPPSQPDVAPSARSETPAPPPAPQQPPLIVKDPAEARREGAAAAAADKRIYENPYAAGDPCRAAWDEGWCGQKNSHGMDVPKAYQRRQSSKPKKDEGKDRDRGGDADGKAA